MRILVTGATGFIGSHVAEALLRRGDTVVGLDNLNDYYDPARKRANLQEVHRITDPCPEPKPRVERGGSQRSASRFTFFEGDIRDRALVTWLFEAHRFDAIVHLAAMAGVRASIQDPGLYYDVNLNGALVLLDAVVGRLNSSAIRIPKSQIPNPKSEIPTDPPNPCRRLTSPTPTPT